MKKTALIIFSFILLAAGLSVLSACSIKSPSGKLAISKQDSLTETVSTSSVAVGKPCNTLPHITNGSTTELLADLQCYTSTAYGSTTVDGVDGSYNGMWIKPNMSMSRFYSHTTAEYDEFLKPWKKYISPDKTISFYYPPNYRVVESFGDDSVNGTRPFQTFTVQGLEPEDGHSDGPDLDYYLVEIVKINNGIMTLDEDVKNEEMNNSFQEYAVEINGSKGIRLNISPKSNLSGRKEYSELFFQKDQYYAVARADITEDPYFAFPAEYLLSTIKLK
jgi:hypothetical protein